MNQVSMPTLAYAHYTTMFVQGSKNGEHFARQEEEESKDNRWVNITQYEPASFETIISFASLQLLLYYFFVFLQILA